MLTQPYEISNEFNITEILSHFDANYIFDVLTDILNNIDYSSSIPASNIVVSFENNFKLMNEKFPGDSQNIRDIREEVYLNIITILCDKFNLQFNMQDETIDKYSAAFYLYDFLVCNRSTFMTSFYVSFIVNNKEPLCRFLSVDDFRKSKDSASVYSKRIYDDQKFAIISANMTRVINYIANLDISLVNIFQSIYNPNIVEFLDNAIADKGNFFKDYYCSIVNREDILPIIITNIRLDLQKLVGNIAPSNISEIMSYGG